MLSNLLRRLVGSPRHTDDPADDDPARLAQQGLSALQSGNAETAIEHFRGALQLGGESAQVLTGLGAAYRSLGEGARAVEYFQRALDAPGEEPRSTRLRNCGLLFLELGEGARARVLLEEAADLRPNDAELQVDLAQLCFDAADSAGGKAHVARALELDRNSARAHLARAVDRLADKDYCNGWPEYEWRFAAGRFQGHVPDPTRRWSDGQPAATLRVTWEQGLGDQIMFASCLPELAGCIERCVVECDERLVGLLRRSFPTIEARPAHTSGESSPVHEGREQDREIAIGSLPGIFRRTTEDFSRPAKAYLHADPARVAYWRQRLRGLGIGPAVGLSWRGGLPHTRRAIRSIEPEVFVAALPAAPAVLVSLQYGEVDADLARLATATGRRIHHWPEVIADYDETAALVTALDLVLSTCTSIVHLAGALGSTVWVLVPQVAEWRYGRSGKRLDWYGGVRLFRQSTLGDWQPVVRRIAATFATGELRVARPG